MLRFSKDMETVDSSLSGSLRAVTGTPSSEYREQVAKVDSGQLAGFIAGVLTIASILPGFLIPAAVIAYLYWRVRGYRLVYLY